MVKIKAEIWLGDNDTFALLVVIDALMSLIKASYDDSEHNELLSSCMEYRARCRRAQLRCSAGRVFKLGVCCKTTFALCIMQGTNYRRRRLQRPS